MENPEKEKLNPRKIFWKCGACSHAMFHLLNHHYNNVKEREEKASDLLAGGIAQKGYQCGMLWGSSLAAGNEAFRRLKNQNEAVATAVTVTQHLVESFTKRTKSMDCRDIANVDWDNKFQSIIYMIKTILRGFVYSPCFHLIVRWTPEATLAADNAFSIKPMQDKPYLSCASEVLKKMGATDEESIMVAGFAGGIGLSGNACGALGAVIWYKMLQFGDENQGKSQSMFNNPEAKKILRTFYMQTDSEILCSKICEKRFETIEEHTEFIQNGGCAKIISALSKL